LPGKVSGAHWPWIDHRTFFRRNRKRQRLSRSPTRALDLATRERIARAAGIAVSAEMATDR
jgi:hypothetical protein